MRLFRGVRVSNPLAPQGLQVVPLNPGRSLRGFHGEVEQSDLPCRSIAASVGATAMNSSPKPRRPPRVTS